MSADPEIDLAAYSERLSGSRLATVHGRVVDVVGLVVEGLGVDAPTGTICRIRTAGSARIFALMNSDQLGLGGLGRSRRIE